MAWNNNYIGQSFEQCKIIKRAENKNGCVKVICLCECGREYETYLSNLLKNKATSCPICRSDKRIKNLAGKKYGKLTPIRVATEEDMIKHSYSNNRVSWLCRCDCGNECIVPSSLLVNNNTKSCGCYRKECPSLFKRKNNKYDLSKEYGIGYTHNTNKEFYFDLDDYELISKYSWSENNDGYIYCKRKINGKYFTILLHRLVMGVLDNPLVQVDHKKHIVYDNRKSQLRVCSLGQNNLNHKIMKNNTTGYNGVGFDKRNGMYTATISLNNEHIWLGYYNNKEDANNARMKAERKYFGEFSYEASMSN